MWQLTRLTLWSIAEWFMLCSKIGPLHVKKWGMVLELEPRHMLSTPVVSAIALPNQHVSLLTAVLLAHLWEWLVSQHLHCYYPGSDQEKVGGLSCIASHLQTLWNLPTYKGNPGLCCGAKILMYQFRVAPAFPSRSPVSDRFRRHLWWVCYRCLVLNWCLS